MKAPTMRTLQAGRRTRALFVLAGVCCGLSTAPARAQAIEAHADEADLPKWEAVIGPFALHFSNGDEHKNVVLIGVERADRHGTLWGFSAFRNSFGQASAYAYYGHVWNNVFDVPSLYLKLSAGIVYGYKEPYEDKVPLNHNGFGLGIIPAIGYRLTPRDSLQVGVLGTAGLIFTYNRRF